jgi:pseudaminic acid synthase
MIINNREIGLGKAPYIIAEMSANHNGDISNAYKIIDMAKYCGADAVKLQTYTPDTLTIDTNLADFQITDGLWAGKSLYELYASAFMPWGWHKPLFEYANKIGITIFSSPFDNSAVDLLEDLNSPAYKIASFEAIDIPLIKYVAQTGKPMIISTGMADEEEIQEAIDAACDGGCNDLAILHCVSSYPAQPTDYNLKTLVNMQEKFGLVTGLSDHTIENFTAITSVALGASIIEKHVTLNRNGGGPDDSFSLDSEGLEQLCIGTKIAWESIGKIEYGRHSSEQSSIKFRRSLYAIDDIKIGEKFTKGNVRSIRPGFGLPPKNLDKVYSMKAAYNISKGTPISWDLTTEI